MPEVIHSNTHLKAQELTAKVEKRRDFSGPSWFSRQCSLVLRAKIGAGLMQASCSHCSQAFQRQAGPQHASHVHSHLCAGPQKSPSRPLFFPTLNTFRKFFSLSLTEDIHHSPQQRRGSHNFFLGFIKYVQEPICSCCGEAERSPLSCAA